MPGDEELMLAASRGDLDAFEQIVRRHQARACRIGYRFLGDRAKAEDIAQEAFLRILKAAPRYRASASFTTFLYQVVSRLCLDHVRKKRPVIAEQLPEPHDPAPSPIDALMQQERDQAVRRALDTLPANQRMAMILRCYEGLSYCEIGVAIGKTPKAVDRLLARARTRLAALLEKS